MPRGVLRQHAETVTLSGDEPRRRGAAHRHSAVVIDEHGTVAMTNDLETLQGRWQQVYYERDGVVEPSDDEAGWQPITEISGRNFTVTIADGSVVLAGVFAIFDTVTPKAVDWTDVSGPYACDHTIPAIYEVTASTFAFCAAYDGQSRPMEFRTGPGQVLRRMKRL